MSWDVYVMNYRGNPPAEITEDMPPPAVMGSSADVRSMIDAHLGGVDWSDPAWGVFDGDGFSFEFNMREESQRDGFMVHVRGGGDAVAALLAFSVPNGWSVLDMSTGGFIDPDDPSNEGWEKFQAYRDQVVTRRPNDSEA